MPSLARTILLALHATAFVAFTGLVPITAVASPVTPTTASLSGLLAPRLASKNNKASAFPPASAVSPSPATVAPQSNAVVVNRIRAYADSMKTHSSEIERLANHAKSQHARRAATDIAFQQQCVQAAEGFRDDMQGFHSLLAGIPSIPGAGNACYDPSQGLQEALHDIANANKQVFASLPALANLLPPLAPYLEPILVELKCVLDDTLDLTRVVVDCLLDAVLQILDDLGLGSIVPTVCNLSKSLLGPSLGGLLCL
uniref:Secreted protein n=1 Tax=Mycena chlorophos TaxID=658473 RepID=A0ABQ0L135_MYCCL|nr:predicted protein [Mycena chlorophos]